MQSGKLNISFDDSGSTTTAGDWVHIKLPEPIFLASVALFARPFLGSRAPGNFKIYGSNDGSNWMVLHDQTAEKLVYSDNAATFNISSPGSNAEYQYIGIVVSCLAGADINSYVLQIAEWKLYCQSRGAVCIKVCLCERVLYVSY
jgi:hypothetical protein